MIKGVFVIIIGYNKLTSDLRFNKAKTKFKCRVGGLGLRG